MVVAVGQRHTGNPSRLGCLDIVARIADKHCLARRHAGHLHHEQQGRWIRLLLWQGIAADDPTEITPQLQIVQQRRNEAFRLVGDQGHFNAVLV
ncbi:hypothetical protein D9M71_343050 [compost metagenome]